jgi:hypothetical protein
MVREVKAEAKYALAGADALVTNGQVWTVHDGTKVEGSVQISVFKASVRSQDASVRQDVEKGLSLGVFRTQRVGVLRLRTASGFALRTWVWFPADRNVVELFVMRSDFAGAEHFVRATIAAQLGWPAPPTVTSGPVAPPSPSNPGGTRP